MSLKYIVVIIVVVSIFSCDRMPTEAIFSDEEKVAVELAVKDMLAEYQAAVKKGGLAAEFAFLDSSSDFYWVPPGYTAAISYDSVATVLRGGAPLFRSIDSRWDKLKVIPLSENLANYTGVLSSVMIDTSGKQNQIRLIESGTVIKRRDGWKLLGGQTAIMNAQ